MSFNGGTIFTDRGRALQAKAQAGAALVFTRIAVGDGELGSQVIADLTDLINEIKSLDINKFKTMTGGKAVVGGKLSNQDIVTGFYWRELGLFATDPDLGEILYCYGNAGALAEYIPSPGGAEILEKQVDIVLIVGNAADVSATIDDSLVYVSQADFEEHTDDTVIHVSQEDRDAWDAKETTTGAQAKADAAAGAALVAAANYTDQEVGAVAGAVNDFAVAQGEHEAESATQAHLAKNIGLEDAAGKFTATELEEAMLELFTFANDGKTGIASVVGSPATSGDTFAQLEQKINDGKYVMELKLAEKGVSAVYTESLQTLANKIGQIDTGLNPFTIPWNPDNTTIKVVGKVGQYFYARLNSPDTTLQKYDANGNLIDTHSMVGRIMFVSDNYIVTYTSSPTTVRLYDLNYNLVRSFTMAYNLYEISVNDTRLARTYHDGNYNKVGLYDLFGNVIVNFSDYSGSSFKKIKAYQEGFELLKYQSDHNSRWLLANDGTDWNKYIPGNL